MDGPFGEGHQTWWDYEVVVFVAGGIGVTPFASILKDIAYKLEHSKYLKTKKVCSTDGVKALSFRIK